MPTEGIPVSLGLGGCQESAPSLVSLHFTKYGAYKALNSYFWNLAIEAQFTQNGKALRKFNNDIRTDCLEYWNFSQDGFPSTEKKRKISLI